MIDWQFFIEETAQEHKTIILVAPKFVRIGGILYGIAVSNQAHVLYNNNANLELIIVFFQTSCDVYTSKPPASKLQWSETQNNSSFIVVLMAIDHIELA